MDARLQAPHAVVLRASTLAFILHPFALTHAHQPTWSPHGYQPISQPVDSFPSTLSVFFPLHSLASTLPGRPQSTIFARPRSKQPPASHHQATSPSTSVRPATKLKGPTGILQNDCKETKQIVKTHTFFGFCNFAHGSCKFEFIILLFLHFFPVTLVTSLHTCNPHFGKFKSTLGKFWACKHWKIKNMLSCFVCLSFKL